MFIFLAIFTKAAVERVTVRTALPPIEVLVESTSNISIQRGAT